MASITIRNSDNDLTLRLRLRAARKNNSVEEEVRSILAAALAEEEKTQENLADRIRSRFQCVGFVDLKIPDRDLLVQLRI